MASPPFPTGIRSVSIPSCILIALWRVCLATESFAPTRTRGWSVLPEWEPADGQRSLIGLVPTWLCLRCTRSKAWLRSLRSLREDGVTEYSYGVQMSHGQLPLAFGYVSLS